MGNTVEYGKDDLYGYQGVKSHINTYISLYKEMHI